MTTPLDLDVANKARALWRSTVGLGKVQDAVHIASAQKWNISLMHTYDNDDILPLNGNLFCRNGDALVICYPDETTDGRSSKKKLDDPDAAQSMPKGKLGAGKLTSEEQKRRFIEAAREAGASEDEADFDAALKRIAKPGKRTLT